MKRTLRWQQNLLFIFFLTFLLSGCFNQTSSLFENEKRTSPAQQVNLQQFEENNEELQLDEVESSAEIEQELLLLNQTGTWQNPQPSSLKIKQKPSSLYDFPIVVNKQVEAYIKLFQGKKRQAFTRFLRRSGRYLAIIEQEFTRRGLPKDLAYLAMVESGFNPRARSHAKAVGLWQFMSGTGKEYNLKINNYIDERCNVEKSTKAAANYLSDLYQDFGDWYLAVAAYNAGPGKIRKGLQKYKIDNFWDLAAKKHLRMETIRYVPKLLATIIIAREPEKYGFSNLQFEKPLDYDTLVVGPALALDAVALVSGSSSKQIHQLNPELLRKTSPAYLQHYKIKIPKGKKQLAENNLKRLHSVATTAYKNHTIRSGDTLRKICKRYNINTTTLLKVNQLKTSKLIKGKKLRIPYSTISYKLLPEGTKNTILANKENLILHKVKKGDTLGAIARHYNIPIGLIVSWNDLKDARKIRTGQQLALFIDKAGRSFAANSGEKPQIIVATRTKIHHTSLSQQQQKKTIPQYYQVKRGDSLWRISRKFHVSMAEIKRWNRLKSDFLKPGKTLKITKG